LRRALVATRGPVAELLDLASTAPVAPHSPQHHRQPQYAEQQSDRARNENAGHAGLDGEQLQVEGRRVAPMSNGSYHDEDGDEQQQQPENDHGPP
jgi:hypothetical protein